MGLPGPPVGLLALGLVLWAASIAALGELLRELLARRVRLLDAPHPVERLVVDFYLGGAVLYLVAVIPGGFSAPAVLGLPIAGAFGLLVRVILAPRTAGAERPATRMMTLLLRPWTLVALVSALALFAVELALASTVPTGNTFDSSLLTLFTALLLLHHQIPFSLSPVGTTLLPYPQGITVWLGSATSALSLPPARTALLVTPLFFGLAPLAGFAFARRCFESERAAAAAAVSFAFLAPFSRGIVGGSNDFVFAFPLVLLLFGWSVALWRGKVPRFSDAVAFGLAVGYAAAINPVGSEVILPALLVLGLLGVPTYGGHAGRWVTRWVSAGVIALVPVLPSLYTLALGHASPGFTVGAGAPPPGSPTGLSTPGFVGLIDPYLFRPTDVWLSPVPILRLELAVLLTVGLGLFLLTGRTGPIGRYVTPFRELAVAVAAASLGYLVLLWAASTGAGPGVELQYLTNSAELSALLFTVYALIATVPLALAFEWLHHTLSPRSEMAPSPEGGTSPLPRSVPRRRREGRQGLPPAVVPLALVLLLVGPGVVLLPTQFRAVSDDLYLSFGNVTMGDFDLLQFAAGHLPPGARVLVAPGSAAEFLPGYDPNLVILYPMVSGFPWINASYSLVLRELVNGTLDANGVAALDDLRVGFIAVTGNNTVLYPALSPLPLLASSRAALLFHEDDAYLFGWQD